jgi:hypothetical protein
MSRSAGTVVKQELFRAMPKSHFTFEREIDGYG